MGTEALEQLSGRQVIEAAARGELSEAQVERLIERDPALARLEALEDGVLEVPIDLPADRGERLGLDGAVARRVGFGADEFDDLGGLVEDGLSTWTLTTPKRWRSPTNTCR